MTIELDRAFAAAKEAYTKAVSNPVLVKCTNCKGKGYHHGFGEDGSDPDWCSVCGGGGCELAEGEEDRPLREAIVAYLSSTKSEKVAVKALKFTNPGLGIRYAHSIVGTYHINEDGYWWLNNGPIEGFGDEAAVTRDYESRIRAALASEPANG